MVWETRWQTGDTPWDAGASPPALEALARGGALTGVRRALVPGCGAGYDVMTLARAGIPEVVGLDLAPSALPHFERLRADAGLSPAQARLELGDFFARDNLGRFDLIWDYTFLCALPPTLRPAWKEQHLARLTPPGRLYTLLFPVDPTRSPDLGPPYALEPTQIEALLAPQLLPERLEPAPHSHPARQGREWLACWRWASPQAAASARP